jgi:1-aminocyclopropane-1-carboxylate deaminase/D-cysteine desulfhydrase-like pyridoxal-dependent ACC family enzyme
MPRLSNEMGRPVYFKREDLAGLAIGGSKVRILRFTAGDALARGADLFVAGGYVQSNHPALVAAVGCALGIPTEIVLNTVKGYELQGNLLLLTLMRVQVHFVRAGTYEATRDECIRLVERLTRQGHHPCLLTLTAEIHTLSALAYLDGFIELKHQLDAVGITDADIFVGSGGPTFAGLLLGARAMGGGLRVHGAPPHGLGPGARERVLSVAGHAMKALNQEIPLKEEDVSLLGDGTGVYGFAHTDAIRAVRDVAKAEGVFLDPVYTGNGMVEMRRWVERHPGTNPVVFFHTGGVATVFAYERELVGLRSRKARSARRIFRVHPSPVVRARRKKR